MNYIQKSSHSLRESVESPSPAGTSLRACGGFANLPAWPESGRGKAQAPGDNRLPALAAEIEAAHQAAYGAARTALEHAAECGRLLLEAKAAVGHGGWLPWLEANTSVSARQSQKYMRLAANWSEIEGKCGRSSHLTLTAAVALLAEPKGEPRDEPDEELVPMSVYIAAARPLRDGETEIALDKVLPQPPMARRSEVNPAAIRRYAKRLFDLPPIEINQHNQLIDGWYRLEAHKLAGATTVRAVVTEVENELHHLELFCMRNSRHGLAYTDEDEQRYQDRGPARLDADIGAPQADEATARQPERERVVQIDTIGQFLWLKMREIHPRIRMHATGLDLPEVLTKEQWLAVGELLAPLAGAVS